MIRVETEIFISAPPERVWAVLMDWDKYPEWNPFIKRIRGEKLKGARLSNVINNPDGSGTQMHFRPRITIIDDNKMLAWKGRFLFPGIFDGCHYFRLVPAGQGTLFTHGEAFSGILAKMNRKTILGKYPKAFEAMNHALAERIG